IVEGSPVKIDIYAASVSESNTSFAMEVNEASAGAIDFPPINDVIFARGDALSKTQSAGSDQVSVKLTYNNGGNPASVGYLDYINVRAKRKLIAGSQQFLFTNEETAAQTGIGNYHLENAGNITQIWDVTDVENIKSIAHTEQSNTIDFKAQLGEKRQYLAISPSDYYTPEKPQKSKLKNVNLKGNIFTGSDGSFQNVDYIIIAPENLLGQASRLAQHRSEHDGLNVKVVLEQDIYEEFSSGKQDIGA